jgi:hypothetical protein
MMMQPKTVHQGLSRHFMTRDCFHGRVGHNRCNGIGFHVFCQALLEAPDGSQVPRELHLFLAAWDIFWQHLCRTDRIWEIVMAPTGEAFDIVCWIQVKAATWAHDQVKRDTRKVPPNIAEVFDKIRQKTSPFLYNGAAEEYGTGGTPPVATPATIYNTPPCRAPSIPTVTPPPLPQQGEKRKHKFPTPTLSRLSSKRAGGGATPARSHEAWRFVVLHKKILSAKGGSVVSRIRR